MRLATIVFLVLVVFWILSRLMLHKARTERMYGRAGAKRVSEMRAKRIIIKEDYHE